MRIWSWPIVLLIATLLHVTLPAPYAAGQSSNSTPSGPTGTGPRVDVQISPNGTIEVGGARGSDVDLTGENFRGSFGASRSQSGGQSPSLPSSSLPPGGRSPWGAPNFGPSLPGGSAYGEEDILGALDGEAGVSELILPRFRQGIGGNALPSSARRTTTESWRYQFFRGRWWYWQPAQSWVYWDGSRWQNYPQRQTAPPTGGYER